jgi:hypothetical protein
MSGVVNGVREGLLNVGRHWRWRALNYHTCGQLLQHLWMGYCNWSQMTAVIVQGVKTIRRMDFLYTEVVSLYSLVSVACAMFCWNVTHFSRLLLIGLCNFVSILYSPFSDLVDIYLSFIFTSVAIFSALTA